MSSPARAMCACTYAGTDDIRIREDVKDIIRALDGMDSTVGEGNLPSLIDLLRPPSDVF